jgi:hypothetical protein
MPDEMIIFTPTFDLLNWLLPKLEGFPRLYRATVTQRMMDAALDFQETLLDAQGKRGEARLTCLRAADANLNKFRIYLRLAYHWRWLSNGQYHHISQMVAEVRRLLGGWIKQTQGN